MMYGSLFDILVVVFSVLTASVVIHRRRSKNGSNELPEDLKPIIVDIDWYYRDLVEGKTIDANSSNAFDNVAEFYAVTFMGMSQNQQMRYFSLLFAFQDEISGYVSQIRDDVKKTGVYRSNDWYRQMSELFVVLYRKTLLATYEDVILEHPLEFEELDFTEYRKAINQLEVWQIQADASHK